MVRGTGGAATRMSEPKPSSDEVLAWLAEGVDKGYCSEGFCWTHDLPEVTDTESERFAEGEDPCVPAVRVNLGSIAEDPDRSRGQPLRTSRSR